MDVTLNVNNKQFNAIEYRQKKLFLDSHPVYAWFSLTGKCNLSCEHCPAIRNAEENRDITDEVYDKFCTEMLPYLEKVKIGANNFGEQLLSRKVIDFMNKANKLGVRVKIWTNGILLRKDVVDVIVKTKTDVTVSVEGVGKNYEKIKHLPFSIVERNVKELLSRRKKKKDFSVEFAFTAFKWNLDDLYSLVDVGVDKIRIVYVRPKDDKWESKSFSYAEIQKLQKDFFPMLIETACQKGVNIDYEPVQPGGKKEKLALSCPYPWTRVSIRENGDVLPCCFAGDSLIMGNISKHSFSDVWNGKQYLRFRRNFIRGKLRSTCRICKGLYCASGHGFVQKSQKIVKNLLVSLKMYELLKILTRARRKFQGGM